jgi:hypothetical protein
MAHGVGRGEQVVIASASAGGSQGLIRVWSSRGCYTTGDNTFRKGEIPRQTADGYTNRSVVCSSCYRDICSGGG